MIPAQALAGLLGILPKTVLKPIADLALSAAEKFIGETKTEVDDKILLPAIGGVRKAFAIEHPND